MTTIHVPELYCPVPTRISPYVEKAELEVLAWMKQFNLADDAAIEMYKNQRFVHMTARFYPEISHERLVILSKFYTLLFLSDDLLDHQDTFKEKQYWQQFAKEFMDVVKGKVYYSIEDQNPPLAALSELWAQITGLSTISWRTQFIESLWMMYKAAFWENENISTGVNISLEEYVSRRQYLGAANIATDAIGFAYPGTSIPKVARTNPKVLRMVENCRNTICWANDLFSLAKELDHGGIHNLVLLIKEAKGISLNPALMDAAEFHDKDVHEFYKLWPESLEYTQHQNNQLEGYFGALLDLMRGNIDWSIKDTSRYYNFSYGETIVPRLMGVEIYH